MLAVLAAFAFAWPMGPVDKAWARLATDAAARDVAAFARDRGEIAGLYADTLSRWGATRREAYAGPGYAVTTFDGPTRVRGERGAAAYFAIVTPSADLAPPTLWQVTPGFAPEGGAVWNLQVSGCDLVTGDTLAGHPRQWRTFGLAMPPDYTDFKATLAATIAAGRQFPDDTAVGHTPGTMCLYVGNVWTERLHAAPRTP